MIQRAIPLLIVFCLLGLNHTAFGQKDQLSVNLSYPIPIADAGYADYKGIGKAEFTYSHSLLPVFDVGAVVGYSRSGYHAIVIDKTAHLFRAGLSLSTSRDFEPRFYLQPELRAGLAVLALRNHKILDEDIRRGWFAETMVSVNYRLTGRFALGVMAGYEFVNLNSEVNYGASYRKYMHTIQFGLRSTLTL